MIGQRLSAIYCALKNTTQNLRAGVTYSALMLISTLLCSVLPVADAAENQQPNVQHNELNADSPRLLKQMLNSEQAQHSIKITLAEHATLSSRELEQSKQGPAFHPAITSFLRKQEISVESISNLTQLATPAFIGQYTLFLFNTDATLTEQYQTQLLNWVTQGGHLILSAEQVHDTIEPALLQFLGITKQEIMTHNTLNRQADQPATMHTDQHAVPSKSAPLTRLYLENEQSPAYLAFANQHHLHDSHNRAHAWANSPVGTHLLQLTYGNGLLTVLSDFSLWQRHSINQYDHAWLLWYLSQDSEVLLLNQSTQLGVLTRFWQPYAVVFISLLVLLLFGAGYAAPRLAQRHSGLAKKHGFTQAQIHALGQLSYSSQRSLLISLQKDIQRYAHLHSPDIQHPSVAEQWQQLQQLSGLPITFIALCMRPPPTKKLSHPLFILHMTRLRQLKSALRKTLTDAS